MKAKAIDLGYSARDAFVPFHTRKARWACIVAHRRAGKTVACIMDLIDAALRCTKHEGRFAYVAPTYTQAKDVAWSYLKRFTASIPNVEQRESDLTVNLPNGARIRLYGSDNYDRMRGLYFDGVVLDEYADMDPRAWTEVVRPALADRQGWATFIGTPKGKNALYQIWDKANGDPDWFTARLRASETGLLPDAELESARKLLSPESYLREFECDFDAAVEGAYYADGLRQAEKDGRITGLALDPILGIKAYWDLGIADAMTIWIVQAVRSELRFIDYIEGEGQPLSYYANELRRRGYEQAECVLPHDGAKRDSIYGTRFEDHLRSAGFTVRTVPNQGRGAAMQRVETARRLFPRIWFDDAKTKSGRDALAAYHEKRDEQRNIGLGPNHDWASHAADSFGLACIDYKEPANITRSRYLSASQQNDSWMTA